MNAGAGGALIQLETGKHWEEDVSVKSVAAYNTGFALLLRIDGSVVVRGDTSIPTAKIPLGLNGIVDLSVGATRGIALKKDGTFVIWGDGDVAPPGSVFPVPSGITDVVAVKASDYHLMALTKSGKVFAWGNNVYGQCAVPQNLEGVVAIAAGAYHSLALKSDGTVVSWGGMPEMFAIKDPIPMPSELQNIVRIAAGGFGSFAIRADGTLYSWGGMKGRDEVPNDMEAVADVSGGSGLAIALTETGSIDWLGLRRGRAGLPSGFKAESISSSWVYGTQNNTSMRPSGKRYQRNCFKEGPVLIRDQVGRIVWEGRLSDLSEVQRFAPGRQILFIEPRESHQIFPVVSLP